MNKSEMRASIVGVLHGIGAEELAERSLRVARRLEGTAAWEAADTLLCFLSMPYEVDTAPLVAAARAQGKAVAVPRIEANDIRFLLMPSSSRTPPRDAWGIPMPDPSRRPLDLARATRPLVAAPGLAFDRQGNRLGRGKGYYDRFLAAARAATSTLTAVGICLSEQLVDAVPHGPGDQPLDGVVTDSETILLRPRR